MDAVSEGLLRAADYIQEHGWVKYTLESVDGAVCLLGALHKTCQPGRWVRISDNLYIKVHSRLENYLHVSIPVFNDTICEDKEQAIAVLREAAAAWEEPAP